MDADYRILNAGETILPNDEYDASNDHWRDEIVWRPVSEVPNRIGQPAPNPCFPAHTLFRRLSTERAIEYGEDLS